MHANKDKKVILNHPLQQLNPFYSFWTTLIPESSDSTILTLLMSLFWEFFPIIDSLINDILSVFCWILSANDDRYWAISWLLSNWFCNELTRGLLLIWLGFFFISLGFWLIWLSWLETLDCFTTLNLLIWEFDNEDFLF